MDSPPENLQHTPLHGLHVELNAKMVPFAGYDMPVQYAMGVLKEHKHTRAAAGLFDVSHMGQAAIRGADAIAALESLVPGDIAGLAPGQMRYTQFTNEAGGILDDLMVTRWEDHLSLVVNAACKQADFAHMQAAFEGRDAALETWPEQALIALQGPQAADVLTRIAPAAGDLVFMTAAPVEIGGIPCIVSRSGYTGEDGFEISVPAGNAAELARRLLKEQEVEPVGLGARDSLRLEAGLCLYGHDIDETTTPVEAQLAWSIGKRRRKEGGFPGAEAILKQLSDGPPRKRVGILPEGRAPAREGTTIYSKGGAETGKITSGGFGPSVGGPVAMGYVAAADAAEGTALELDIRGKRHDARVAALPFVKPGYRRG